MTYTANPDTLLHIPRELQAIKGWLLWKYDKPSANGKRKKHPYYVRVDSGGYRRSRHHSHGSPNDRGELGRFEEALAAIKKGGAASQFSGIGLAMLPEWNLVAVDLDEGFHPDLLDLVSITYVEKSPSGRGFRAFFWGWCTDGKDTACNHIETFHATGYVTVTGNRVNTHEIVELTPEIRSKLMSATGKTTLDRAINKGRPAIPKAVTEQQQAELAEALEFIDPDPRENWIKVGYCLKNIGEPGQRLWMKWSSKSPKFDSDECQYTWAYLKPERAGIEGIFSMATKGGWVNPLQMLRPECEITLHCADTASVQTSDVRYVVGWRAYQTYFNGKNSLGAMPWIKVYGSQFLDDPRFFRLSETAKAWLMPIIMLARGCNQHERGMLKSSIGDIAFRLRLSEDDVRKILAELEVLRYLSRNPNDLDKES